MTLKERIEDSPLWWLASATVAGFMAGVTVLSLIMNAVGMEAVRKGTWIAKDTLDGEYVKRSEIAGRFTDNDTVTSEFVPKEQLHKQYIRRDDVQVLYMLRSECPPTAVSSVSSTAEVSGETRARPVSKTAGTDPLPTREQGGFVLQLRSCQRSGTIVTCSLLLTSREKDRCVHFADEYTGGARAIDSEGGEYKIQSASLGSESGHFSVQSTLPSGIPVQAGLIFRDFSGSGQLRLLEVNIADCANNHFKFKFTDVALL